MNGDRPGNGRLLPGILETGFLGLLCRCGLPPAWILGLGSLLVLDLNFTKLLVLGVIALVVFGPDRLPGLAAQAGRALRELRKMAEGAKSELQENLGPEFSQLDLTDLNPKTFVRKHLLDELTGDGVLLGALTDKGNGNGNGNGSSAAQAAPVSVRPSLPPGETPPFDAEAT
jgi:sec-independent protein translocase protein TatB